MKRFLVVFVGIFFSSLINGMENKNPNQNQNLKLQTKSFSFSISDEDLDRMAKHAINLKKQKEQEKNRQPQESQLQNLRNYLSNKGYNNDDISFWTRPKVLSTILERKKVSCDLEIKNMNEYEYIDDILSTDALVLKFKAQYTKSDDVNASINFLYTLKNIALKNIENRKDKLDSYKVFAVIKHIHTDRNINSMWNANPRELK